MASFITALGLGASQPRPTATLPNYGPAFLIFHFIFAYGVLSSRTAKQYYGIDHNVSPREDLAKYGEAAVKSGKLTQKQLEMLRRNESAHANAVENFTLLVGSMLFATVAGVDKTAINRAGLVYTVARVCYGVIYIFVNRPALSQMRGIMWWTGNVSCLYLLWKAGGALNRDVE